MFENCYLPHTDNQHYYINVKVDISEQQTPRLHDRQISQTYDFMDINSTINVLYASLINVLSEEANLFVSDKTKIFFQQLVLTGFSCATGGICCIGQTGKSLGESRFGTIHLNTNIIIFIII
jgi:hypothetical protein